MKIELQYSRPSRFSQENLHDLLLEALHFYIDKLGLFGLDFHLNVKVFRSRYQLHNGNMNQNLNGQVLRWKEKTIPTFDIELLYDDFRTSTSLFVTLAHECVHIKQYVLDELVPDFSIPYEERPWEIEAFSMETELFMEFYNSKFGNKQQ